MMFFEGIHNNVKTVISHNYCSQVAAPMLPVGDPAMFITNLFLRKCIFIVRRATLAWLHLVQP